MSPAIPTPIARRIGQEFLSRMTSGRLDVYEGRRHMTFGPGGAPSAVVNVRDPQAWNAVLHGSRGLADGYAAGLWDTPDLVAVIRVAARNVVGLDEARERWALVRRPYQRVRGWRGSNTRESSREDIGAHYDLGNDLFEAMLDPTMMYSSGYFPEPGATLETASLAKLELVCAKLDLGPRDHVLEIGTGWGGFAVHAASTRGCRVTTTTISVEQHEFAVARVKEAGLEDLVTILRQDYRDLTGRYDKLVSLEMIEAVGWRDFDTFFRVCSDRLVDDGAMLLQAITMDDRAYEVEKASNSFIRHYIFPNGSLPSQEIIARCVARETDMRTVHLEDMTAHYPPTLAQWRENFEAGLPALRRTHGYDERFARLWRMYLAYCEAGFLERRIGVGQTVFAKPAWRGPVPQIAELNLPSQPGHLREATRAASTG
jgi:cyclopropane-fatty-acyl-phospholipid synthase